MTQSELTTILNIIQKPNERFSALSRLEAHLATIEPENPATALVAPQKGTPTRTQSQHNALFMWFSMIEHEAQNAGITWNQVVGKTHQLKITKEGLHVMAKQLAEALWGIKSTKELKKQGHIDDLVDHFVDLFSKVGLELPAFPNDKDRGNDLIKAMDKANAMEYPVDEYDGKAGDFGDVDN